MMVDYVPLTWPADTLLSDDEREHVDRERRSLWDHGVRKEPLLTRMAFEFGAVAAMVCGPRKRGNR
jgi:hypothetical protein